jgi:hypothetical protein
MTDTAALASIGAATRELRLPVIRNDARNGSPNSRNAPNSPTSCSWLRCLRARSTNALRAAVNAASMTPRFPRLKRLADFDLDAAPSVNPATIASLAGGGYLDAGEPVVLLGDVGTP